jgi:hypothetical protein
MPTYFPNTGVVAEARRVSVGVGQEVQAIDVTLIPGRAATLSGRVLDARGQSLAGRSVQVNVEFRGPGASQSFGVAAGSTAADGTFSVRNVPPGEIRLIVYGPSEQSEEASLHVTVDGTDVNNLVLAATEGWTVSGRFVMGDGSAPTAPRERFSVRARALDADSHPRSQHGYDDRSPGGEWTFNLSGLFGPVQLVATVPTELAVKAIQFQGRDVIEGAIEMQAGETASDVAIVLTDRVSSVTATVIDDKGTARSDATLILFSVEEERWTSAAMSRWVRAVRGDQQGQFRIRGLPAGEFYAVAIDYVEDGLWSDPEYLQSLVRYAQRVTVDEAEEQVVALKISTVALP